MPELPDLERGVFTLSLDFELIWGTLDLFGPERFRRDCELERDAVVRLLDLLVEFDVSATWCVLGHLFLNHCAAEEGRKHPEIVRTHHAWCNGDWFAHDPAATEEDAPTFYGAALVTKIQSCPVYQEIGCHTFSHVIFGDPGCSRACAASELAACAWLAEERGLHLRSFAFPRNRVGHVDVLAEHGFTCYRGVEPVWYEHPRCPPVLRRLGHLWDVLTARRPPVVLPQWDAHGLWNLPGSMIFYPSHGRRRHIPMGLRVRRAVKGLKSAARSRRIFHLWFHPTNLVDETGAMFAGLRAILEYARDLRQRGELDILPMSAVVERANRRLPVA
jgi:peptidoglycan/xylan/chitin deacetylase (PgdA/CDA1 family)